MTWKERMAAIMAPHMERELTTLEELLADGEEMWAELNADREIRLHLNLAAEESARREYQESAGTRRFWKAQERRAAQEGRGLLKDWQKRMNPLLPGM